jgi:hypothetical protein
VIARIEQPVDSPAEALEPAAPTDPTGDKPTTPAAAEQPPGDGREAAKYRRQLRETEAERDTLSSRVEAMQKREVERLAAVDLATPADMWLTGTALPDLLDDEGHVDAAKVGDTIQRIIEGRPSWRAAPVPPSFDGGARATVPTATSYQEILRGGKR